MGYLSRVLERVRESLIRADAMQASYFRAFLEQERTDLDQFRGEHIKRLHMCMSSGATRLAGHHRRSIRETEIEIHNVERMLRALDFRFPHQAVN
jgi:hypothetical protein